VEQTSGRRATPGRSRSERPAEVNRTPLVALIGYRPSFRDPRPLKKMNLDHRDIRAGTGEEEWRMGSRRWSEGGIVVWLFLSLWLTYVYFIPSPYITNPNIISRIGLTLSLAETGSLDIDVVAAHTIDKASSGG